MLLLQPKRLLRKIYPRAEWHYKRNEKNLYLSFDDGPIPGLTEWVLEELERHKAKASFFCVGANILKHPFLFERIRNEGHTLGNHSMFHGKGFAMPIYDYVKDAEHCRNLVARFRLPLAVRFAGSRSDVRGIIRGADFALLPSRSESGPLVLIE